MEAHRPKGFGTDPPRSVRISDDIWNAAKERAYTEGVTISYVLRILLDGYSKGLLDLPTTTVTYSPIRPEDVGPDGAGESYQLAR